MLLSTALNDNVESVWAIEQCQRAAQPVFALLGAPGHLNLRHRHGSHATAAGDIEGYLDWLDWKFGRSSRRVDDAPIYPTYEDWQQAGGTPLDPAQFPIRETDDLLLTATGAAANSRAEWEARRQEIRQRIVQILGEPPPLAADPGGAYGAEPQPVAALLRRDTPPARLVKESLSFGNYVTGDLYYPTNVAGTTRQLPAFVWLHPLSVSHGYVAGYHRGRRRTWPLPAVVTPCSRLTRSATARASKRCAISTSVIRTGRCSARRWPTPGRRWMSSAAIDTSIRTRSILRVTALAPSLPCMRRLSMTGWRARLWSGASRPGGSTRWRPAPGVWGRWSQALPWLPRLAAFIGEEARIPYDVPELLALIAPRPVQLIAPRIDYQTNLDSLRQAVHEARRVFAWLGAPQALVFQKTDSYNHFSPELVWCLCGVETIP
ncbi:MAG: hypothetical protein M5U12_29185 [Verrucomicrobia bacterium]|nr:hypothetical protein [Verrucomicrobiota bacterium]